ncbi:tyrosine-type recombinase/integrase [Natrinema halophilum]|nr:tyrosine-type recombinase/integrase [Natrinema halophilum]
MLRVWHGKGDKFREMPALRDLTTTIRTVDDVRDAPTSSSLVEITSTRSLRRWIRSAADQLYDETGDAGWEHLGFHDLRRTWATALASVDVDPLLVCDWVGWNDLEPFLEHYRGSYSPEAQQRERSKVNWL